MITVPGYGPSSSPVMIIGEAPGRDEARLGRPFVGASGRAQSWYLSRNGLGSVRPYMTNVCKEYRDGNPDPTPEQIAYWTPQLVEEIHTVQPRLILAVGRFAAHWFIGGPAADFTIDLVARLPHRGGELARSAAEREELTRRACGAVVVPVHHPAAGFYNVDSRAVIDLGYKAAADAWRAIQAGREAGLGQERVDAYAGQEDYRDVSGEELANLLETDRPDEIAIDTEGTPDRPWSIQLCWKPGTAHLLRRSRPDFAVGAAAVQSAVDRGTLVITHDAGTPTLACYDTVMCRAMGIELRDARLWNTMYAAYLMRVEPRGLKALMYRWRGMLHDDYESLLGDIGRKRQIEYLKTVYRRRGEWSKPEPVLIEEPDGRRRMKKPKAAAVLAYGTVRDIVTGKVNKDGLPPDPYDRWMGIDPILRHPIESVLGRMPTATLDDVPLDRALYYAARDADGTFRLKQALAAELERQKLTGLMSTGMDVLPMVEEMQATGLPASRKRFVELSQHVQSVMRRSRKRLSVEFFDGRPINPNSTKQVPILLRRCGAKAEKKTASGDVSIGKKSIEHLRQSHEAVNLIFEFREAATLESKYCSPARERADECLAPESGDLFAMTCTFKPVTVATRRLSASNPNLLNQPSRTELGRRVRACYVAPPGWVYGSVDFSSQEGRVAAHVAGRGALSDAFIRGLDPYIIAAERIFGVRYDLVDKDTQRKPSKVAFLGILYGLSGFGLVDQFRLYGLTGWALDDCERLINQILVDVYPELTSAKNNAAQSAARTGQVRDLFGMIRYLPAIWSDNRAEKAEAERQAFSHIVQGTAQGMMQNAMAALRRPLRRLQKAGYGIRLGVQVHDELVYVTRTEDWPLVYELTADAMKNKCGIRLNVPIEVEGKCAESWDRLK